MPVAPTTMATGAAPVEVGVVTTPAEVIFVMVLAAVFAV